MSGKPNLLDRAIATVSPQWGAQRVLARRRFEALLGGYEGAKPSRGTRFWQTRDYSADSALLPDLRTLRSRSKDLQRNNPLAGGAIETNCTNVVGSGLKVKSRIDRDLLGISEENAQDLEAEFEAEFNLWAESTNCDLTWTQTFAAMQETVLRSTLSNGDCFSYARQRERGLSPFSLKIQLVAAARVSNPTYSMDGTTLDNGNRVAGGIEKNQDGVPVAYYVSEHPGRLTPGSLTWTRVPTRGRFSRLQQFYHHFERIEIDQSRGEPYLAPVIEAFRGLGQYSEAELQAAIVGAAYTVFVKTEAGTGTAPASDAGTDPDKEIRLETGLVVDLAEGESIDIANPGRPNEAFDPFVQAILRQIGARLGLPFEVLIQHFTASYSAARAALLQAWKVFRKRRAWLATSFCQPYYELLITESVLRGRVPAPGLIDGDARLRQAYLGTEWIGPAPGQIDPLKEGQAAKLRIEEELSTRQREAAEINGTDWERNNVQRRREERLRVAAPEPGPALPPPEPPDDEGDLEGQRAA